MKSTILLALFIVLQMIGAPFSFGQRDKDAQKSAREANRAFEFKPVDPFAVLGDRFVYTIGTIICAIEFLFDKITKNSDEIHFQANYF